jgi:hypothetical protein
MLRESGAVLSGTTGAAIHELRSFNRARIHITVPRSSNHRSPFATVRQSDLIEPKLVSGLRVNAIELELELFGRLDADPRIPPIIRQVPVPWCPTSPQRVDGYIDEWGMLLEGDGRLWHARRETMDDDNARDRRAIAKGLLPIRITWHQLKHDWPAVIADILEAGSRRHGWRERAADRHGEAAGPRFAG